MDPDAKSTRKTRTLTRLRAPGVLVSLLWLLPTFAFAQATGTLTGQVADQTGAMLPAAVVEATSQATNQVRTATAGRDGVYTLPLLPPGRYDVKATLQGFGSVIRQGIRVSVAETARVDFSLELGERAEVVSVVGEASLVETANATMGIVIDERKVVDLPLNGRNFTQLGTLIPGVVAPPASLGGQTGDAEAGTNGFGAVTAGFSVNGMRNQSNNFLLDGASNNDTFNTGFVLRPPPDAIQEFKILTHSYGAEYGRNAGSVVNVVTKSGSNEWHGAGWWFNRNDAMNSRNFFAPANQAKPELKQNQFGASAGGPIVADKLFVFGYYEGFRNDSGITQTIVVPTADQRSGNFGSTTIRDPLTGQPFAGNVIPAGRISPISQRMLQDFVPPPNVGANRYTVSPTVKDSRDQFGIRLDYRTSQRHSILARYLWSDSERQTPRTVQPADQLALATLQDVMLSDTFSFGSNAINVARFSFNRIYANPQVTSGIPPSDYGINLQASNPLAIGLPSIAVAGFFTLGDPQQPFVERVNNVFQFADDFTWLKGRHSLKFGVDIRSERMKIAFINRPNGDMTFNGVRSGNALADFLLGLPAQSRATTTQAIQDGTNRLYAGYVQDSFRVSPRVTLNLGLRYELPRPFYDENDAIVGFSTGVQSQVFPQAPASLVYPGDPGVPRGIIEQDNNNFAPRLSAAWDVRGDGRTSVRAAWGLFYDTVPGQGDLFQAGVLAPPFTPLVQVDSPSPITIQDPLQALAGPPRLFPPALIIIGWGQDYVTPSAQHYNLSVQQQVGNSMGVELAYVGSRGKDLPIFIEVNPGVYQPGQTTRGARLMPAYSLVRPTFSVAESWYDSLQASLRLRDWRGLDLLASYTWAHAIDHVSGLNIANAEQPRPLLAVTQGDAASVAAALAQERGDALFDVRHRLVVSFGYELPKLEDRGGFAEAALGGWQLNGIVQWQTGFPLTVVDPSGTIRFLTERPAVVCDPNDVATPSNDQIRGGSTWFNTACFARRPLAATAEPSNQGRNTVRGPGFARTDLSLFKNFRIKASTLQLRLEGFNVLNQVRFNQPEFRIGTPTFGQITSAEDGRVLQLGVKFLF